MGLDPFWHSSSRREEKQLERSGIELWSSCFVHKTYLTTKPSLLRQSQLDCASFNWWLFFPIHELDSKRPSVQVSKFGFFLPPYAMAGIRTHISKVAPTFLKDTQPSELPVFGKCSVRPFLVAPRQSDQLGPFFPIGCRLTTLLRPEMEVTMRKSKTKEIERHFLIDSGDRVNEL